MRCFVDRENEKMQMQHTSPLVILLRFARGASFENWSLLFRVLVDGKSSTYMVVFLYVIIWLLLEEDAIGYSPA